MYSLIYRSIAKDSFDKALIYKMLSEARDFNATHGITGCLLYHKGQFIQMLEGEEGEVISLYDRIKNDQRHDHVELLEEEEIAERIFSEWSMAFQDVGDESQHTKYKEMLLHSYFANSKIYSRPSKSGLALFTGIQAILKKEQAN